MIHLRSPSRDEMLRLAVENVDPLFKADALGCGVRIDPLSIRLYEAELAAIRTEFTRIAKEHGLCT